MYLAEDMRLHRKVALNILSVGLATSKDRLWSLEQEAVAAAARAHSTFPIPLATFMRAHVIHFSYQRAGKFPRNHLEGSR